MLDKVAPFSRNRIMYIYQVKRGVLAGGKDGVGRLRIPTRKKRKEKK